MQKAITPQLSDGYFNGLIERVAGYVIPLDAAAGLQRIPDLIAVHGLEFPATPFSADMPHLGVLRFEATPELFIAPAMGGTDERYEHYTPEVELRNDLRLTDGAELWRYNPDGTLNLIAKWDGMRWRT